MNTTTTAPEPYTWRNQFPTFPPAEMPEIPAEWKDTSWGNDTCPSFECGELRIFVDWADVSEREVNEAGPRFNVFCDKTNSDVFASDDWAAVVEFVGKYANDGEGATKAAVAQFGKRAARELLEVKLDGAPGAGQTFAESQAHLITRGAKDAITGALAKLFDAAMHVNAAYDAHELNDVQPDERTRRVFPMSIDEWAWEIDGLRRAWLDLPEPPPEPKCPVSWAECLSALASGKVKPLDHQDRRIYDGDPDALIWRQQDSGDGDRIDVLWHDGDTPTFSVFEVFGDGPPLLEDRHWEIVIGGADGQRV